MNQKKIPLSVFSVAPGVWGCKHVFVNFYMIQDTVSNDWVLVDTGLKWTEKKIKLAAKYIFGENNPPKAIILTHGHFDHVGSVKPLAEEWQIPVYAHQLEIPYLTGQSAYPPPDPSVGGGMMASMAFTYPYSPINIWKHIKVLPSDGTIPFLHEWNYIHTPGHTPGHISLFRNSDAVLIAGDAFVTTKQESVLSVLNQTKVVSGPPKYFTSDWIAAKQSVEELYKLEPKTAATGHGMPMKGFELISALSELNNYFEEMAVPQKGRYVHHPAVSNANGVVFVPPAPEVSHTAIKAFGLSAVLALGFVYSNYRKNKTRAYNETMWDVDYNF